MRIDERKHFLEARIYDLREALLRDRRADDRATLQLLRFRQRQLEGEREGIRDFVRASGKNFEGDRLVFANDKGCWLEKNGNVRWQKLPA